MIVKVNPKTAKINKKYLTKTTKHKTILTCFNLLKITIRKLTWQQQRSACSVALCSPVKYCTSTSFTNKINNNPEFSMKTELKKKTNYQT